MEKDFMHVCYHAVQWIENKYMHIFSLNLFFAISKAEYGIEFMVERGITKSIYFS